MSVNDQPPKGPINVGEIEANTVDGHLDPLTMDEPSDLSQAWNDKHARGIAAAVQTLNDSSRLQGLAASVQAWNDKHAKGVAAAVQALNDSSRLQGLAASTQAWNDNHAKGIAAAVQALSDSSQLQGLAASVQAWNDKHAKGVAAAVQALNDSSRLQGLAASAQAWNDNHAKGIAAAVQALSDSSQLKGLAASVQTVFKRGLTVDALLGELAARTSEPLDGFVSDPAPAQIVGEFQSALGVGGSFTCEVLPGAGESRALAFIPTWILLVWLCVLMPSLSALVQWETARASLVDLNARLPQTESFSGVRNFIRTEIAGKPGDVRLVTGKDVRLRDGPGMKAGVIMQLPRYAPVVVLGKEDRTWLFVSYEHEGYVIDGYVSTKFLKKVRL
ncbi:MAG: SH3 domain-containing protein [Pseudomonas sp.]|nr:SH3 domain-containing protein [Pseudomonas sp.]